ncbi:MAG: 30S ribosomal protein S20 [Culicoidibacterales bacterium]
MANIQSQIKRNKTNEKRRLFNQSYRSSMRSAVKAVETAVAAKDATTATTTLTVAYAKVDKAVAKGIITKNFAARQKSALATKVNSLA